MSELTIEHLAKAYGDSRVVENLNLHIEEGELVALLGPSGCGKSTTLRMIAGFVKPTEGRILLGGEDIARLPPYRRDTGMVFQSYALFPHMSVAANVGFGLEMRKIGRAERDERIKKALSMVRLDHLAERMPRQLSGGQQQRVALARALAINPKMLLLDEPLSNLDAKLRGEVQHEIRNLQQRLGLTTLMVTHDQDEALTMADRLAMMEGGVVRQIGTPQEIYDTPDDVYVAGFIGRCNLIAGRRKAPGLFVSDSGTELRCNVTTDAGAEAVMFALRPEKIKLAPADQAPLADDQARRNARITGMAYLGAQTEFELDLEGTPLVAVMPTPSRNTPLAALRPGGDVSVTWQTEDARLLPQRS
ncbi:ABC transporter ATP-binding protein [Martelella lutilitoris]|uniref:ABC transporter ATP-binding protein n=1 Tax=Martelella lutilitoris TaxID=2583532 RepID=A0A5C4JNR2_9HYPH|nr:ABC transporter ATP-binding protein [Martelella lutilitoris]TNB46229.1 ABC transporter ATP-binding protein [Martelella lutilitoris]